MSNEQHPENDGSILRYPFSDEVIQSAERSLRYAKYKHWLRNVGRTAVFCVMSYGETSPSGFSATKRYMNSESK